MKAWITLADSAQIESGKLFILGGGIYMVGPMPWNMGVAIQLMAPWESRSKRVHVRIALLDGHNQPYNVPTQLGLSPLEVHADFEFVPSPGTPPGSELPFQFAFNAGALQLPPGTYSWAAFIDNEEIPSSRTSFHVRAAAAPPQPTQT